MMLAHKILNVAPDATAEEVKRAYHALAFRFHPDRGGDRKQFVRLCKAYRDQMEVCRQHRPYQETCIYYTTQAERHTDEVIRAPAPPPFQADPRIQADCPRTNRSLFFRIEGILSNWRSDNALPIVTTIACALIVALQTRPVLGPAALTMQFLAILGLLTFPGALAVLVSGHSVEKARPLFTQIVLAITVCMTLVHPGIIFGGN